MGQPSKFVRAHRTDTHYRLSFTTDSIERGRGIERSIHVLLMAQKIREQRPSADDAKEGKWWWENIDCYFYPRSRPSCLGIRENDAGSISFPSWILYFCFENFELVAPAISQHTTRWWASQAQLLSAITRPGTAAGLSYVYFIRLCDNID